MLILDALLVTLLFGLGVALLVVAERYLRNKRLNDPKQQALSAAGYDEYKGKLNLLKHELKQGQLCAACGKACNPDQDLVVEANYGSLWYHMACFDSLMNGPGNV